MTPAQRVWIDNATHEEMLSKWRTAPVGDPLLQMETGIYFKKIMNEKFAKITSAEKGEE